MTQNQLIKAFESLVKNEFKNYFDETVFILDYIQLPNGKLSDLVFNVYISVYVGDKEKSAHISITEDGAKRIIEEVFENDDITIMFDIVIRAYQELLKAAVK